MQCLSEFDQDILDIAIEDEIVQADEIKERLYAALSKLDPCLSSLGRTPPTTPPVVDAPTTSPPARDPPAADHPGVELTATGRPKVKVPKISLPRFNGNPIKWTTCWDSYRSAVHANSDLSDVDKFNYLRSLLDGTALDAIAGLTLSSGNYQIWKQASYHLQAYGDFNEYEGHLLRLTPPGLASAL